jgi:hypothetical protein
MTAILHTIKNFKMLKKIDNYFFIIVYNIYTNII